MATCLYYKCILHFKVHNTQRWGKVTAVVDGVMGSVAWADSLPAEADKDAPEDADGTDEEKENVTATQDPNITPPKKICRTYGTTARKGVDLWTHILKDTMGNSTVKEFLVVDLLSWLGDIRQAVYGLPGRSKVKYIGCAV